MKRPASHPIKLILAWRVQWSMWVGLGRMRRSRALSCCLSPDGVLSATRATSDPDTHPTAHFAGSMLRAMLCVRTSRQTAGSPVWNPITPCLMKRLFAPYGPLFHGYFMTPRGNARWKHAIPRKPLLLIMSERSDMSLRCRVSSNAQCLSSSIRCQWHLSASPPASSARIGPLRFK
jgi:hypothetical protein